MVEMETICENCGFTYGSHCGGGYKYPTNYCPGTEHGMDWDKGPGTTFKPKQEEVDIVRE